MVDLSASCFRSVAPAHRWNLTASLYGRSVQRCLEAAMPVLEHRAVTLSPEAIA